MAMRIECPKCGKKCQVPEGAEGKTFRCPQCKNTFKATDAAAAKEAPGVETPKPPAKAAAPPAKAAPTPPAKAAPAKPGASPSRIAKPAPPPPPEPEEPEPPEEEREAPAPPPEEESSDDLSGPDELAAPPSEEPSEEPSGESTEAEAPPPPPAEEPPKPPPGGRRPSKLGTARFPPRTGTTRRTRPGAKPDAAAGGEGAPAEPKKGMSMVVIIIIVVVVLGGGGAGAYYAGLFGGGETPANTPGNQPAGNQPPVNAPPKNEPAKNEPPKGPDTSKGVYGVDWHPPLAKDVFPKQPDYKGSEEKEKTGEATEKDVKMECKVKIKWADGKIARIDGYWDDAAARRFTCTDFVAGDDGKSWAGKLDVTSAKGDKLEIQFAGNKIISATGMIVTADKAEDVEAVRTAGRLRDGLQVLLDGAAKALTGFVKEE